jgi:starch synthase
LPYSDGLHEYSDNAERFSFFCLAILHGIPQLDWVPDVIHCHDWHSAMIPVYLRTRFNSHPVWKGVPTLLTIHNLAFQGRYGAEKFPQTGLDGAYFAQDMEYHGDINLLKAGIISATKLSTVSPRYAEEIQTLDYGEGLDGVLQNRCNDLVGILNGANYDLWNPQTDKQIPAKYSIGRMTGKVKCKAALQERMGLPIEPDIPLFGAVSRLSWQKGIDLIAESLAGLFEHPAQVVILGTGDKDLEDRLRWAESQYPGRFRAQFAFDRELSHWIQAGSDFLLMPSRFEPCGLSQIYALKYGTIPIVRRTGGLADSVQDWNAVNRANDTATGLSFVPRTPQALSRCLSRALELYATPKEFKIVRKTAMNQDYSWEHSCEQYIKLYESAIKSLRQPVALFVGS